MKKKLIVIYSLIWYINSNSIEFSNAWITMQNEYKILKSNLNKEDKNYLNQFLHQYWQDCSKQLELLVLGSAYHSFLRHPVIENTMYRMGYSQVQDYELSFLKYCISEDTRNKIKQIKDTNIGGNQITISEFNCSINTLGQIFYLAKLLDLSKNLQIKTIIEFGGGFGCLAHITKQVLPHVTYIIFDIPEILAIEQLFLSMESIKLKILKTKNEPILEGAVNLVPVYWLPDFNYNADIFISAFALTESSSYIQNIVLEKKFFESKISYITGQMKITGVNWEDHNTIIQGIRRLYEKSYCQPFHRFFQGFSCCEIIGLNF